MKPKFYIKDNSLIFTKDGNEEAYKLPHPAKEMVKLRAFTDDLNRRIAKIKNINADMIKTNSHNVFIQVIEDIVIRVKFPTTKEKQILVSRETHTMAKEQAAQADMPMKDYIRLCLVRCKSDKKDS